MLNALTSALTNLSAPQKAILIALSTAFGLGILDQGLGILAAWRSSAVTFDWKLVAHNLKTFWSGTMWGLIVAAGLQLGIEAGLGSLFGGIAGAGFAALYATFLAQTRADIWAKVSLIANGAGAPLALTVAQQLAQGSILQTPAAAVNQSIDGAATGPAGGTTGPTGGSAGPSGGTA